MKEAWAKSDEKFMVFEMENRAQDFRANQEDLWCSLVFWAFWGVQVESEALFGMVGKLIKFPTTFMKMLWAKNDFK